VSTRALPARVVPRPLGRVGPTLDGGVRWFAFAAVVAVTGIVDVAVSPADLVQLLVAAAAGCTAALTLRRAPSLAWLAAIGGSFAAASLPIRFASGVDPGIVGIDAWLGWAAPAALTALAALWIAAGYATRPGRRIDAAPPVAAVVVGWFAVSVIVTVIAVIAGQRADPAFTWVDIATLPIAWFRPLLAVLAALGVIADIRAAVGRARARVTPGAGPWELGAATIRELVPGQVAAEESRAAAERREIAGDLHASVVPNLRRAIEAAEAGAEPGAVLRHLRAADLELERLMADRWPVVLETFGLVSALEDLAERLEDDGAPPIVLEIGRVDGRPPAAVERAAWRVAQITLDNAIRHATARSISVTIATGPARLDLAVADDGRGMDAADRARIGARGLADAEAQAAAVGASFAVQSTAGGTSARFEWVASGAS
jgi:signal transduction histidine kinase